jgi:hypothetical protein
LVQSGIIQFLKKKRFQGLNQVELCNELNINANKKTRYDRLDVAQKVVNIKSVLKKKRIINLKRLEFQVFHVVLRVIG